MRIKLTNGCLATVSSQKHCAGGSESSQPHSYRPKPITMSIATVQTRYCYGLKGNVSSSVWYLDERTILYPSGANLVLCNAEQKMQKFIPLTAGSEGATAMAVSPNKRYVAVAEKKPERPIITVFDLTTLKRKKVLNYAEGTFTEYISLGFSPDSKYLISQGCAPEWTMLYWYWDKAKVMANTKSNGNTTYPVRQVCTEV